MAASARRWTGFAATPERFIDVDWNYEVVGKGEPDGKGVPATPRGSA